MSTWVEASLANRAKEEVSQFETSSFDQDKDRMRKAFHRCLWSQSLPIWKRVVWLVKTRVHEIRWHNKVEVGFVDHFMESNTKHAEQLEVVSKDIPNLIDLGMDIGFHDQLATSKMEIVENLVMDDPVSIGDELCCRASCCEK